MNSIGRGLAECSFIEHLSSVGGAPTRRPVHPSSACGLCAGSLYAGWINTIDRFVRLSGPRAIVAKVALDQLVWTPPSLSSFYFCMALFEGKHWTAGWNRVQTELWPTLMINWPLWSCIQTVTYGAIPVHYRVVWVSTFQVGWMAYLSHVNEKARTDLAKQTF